MSARIFDSLLNKCNSKLFTVFVSKIFCLDNNSKIFIPLLAKNESSLTHIDKIVDFVLFKISIIILIDSFNSSSVGS